MNRLPPFRLKARPILALLAMSLFLFSSSGDAKGKKPPRYHDGVKPERLTWLKEGRRKTLRAVEKDGKLYLPIPQLARLSNGQLRWKTVSQEACLSRVNGLLCVNWDKKRVTENGKPVNDAAEIVFSDNQLFLGVDFIETDVFNRFTQTKIVRTDKRVVQTVPENVVFHPVSKGADHYLLSISKNAPVAVSVLEKSSRRIWVRFQEGRFGGSRVMDGDKFLKEVLIKQRRHSADLVINLGKDAYGEKAEIADNDERFSVWIPTDPDAEPKFKPAVPLPAVAARPDLKPLADGETRTIVIDAGHGGIDSGAIGTRGTLEKDVNLKVALKLAKELRKNKDVRVILTREKDEFLALSERTAIANKVEADLFVSIHCNSSLNSKAKGFEVYLLSPDATDAAAAAVARLENSVVALEDDKDEYASKAQELLASMAVNNFINESSECAGHICMGVKKHSNVDKTSVKEANFYVLRGAQMPAVLVELDYLSNPVTELKLRSSRFLSKISDGIAKGLMAYDKKARTKIGAHGDKKRLSMK